MSALSREAQFIDSHGWKLHLERTVDLEAFRDELRPILLIPGFAMNKFILGFHPGGRSMISELARAGFEVWALDMRGQGPSHAIEDRALEPGIWAYAQLDIQSGIDFVLEHTASKQNRVDLIGSSLGGSLVYAHLALHPRIHRVGAVVTLGAPLVWDQCHPILKTLSRFSRLMDAVDLRGSEALVRRILPYFASLPVLKLYVNRAHFALDDAPKLLQTLTFSAPSLNREMAAWVRSRRLLLNGLDIAESLRDLQLPLLAFIANRDGLVPPAAVRSVARYWGTAAQQSEGEQRLQFIEVGDDDDWYAHADMFIAPQAPRLVFEPMAKWLEGQSIG